MQYNNYIKNILKIEMRFPSSLFSQGTTINDLGVGPEEIEGKNLEALLHSNSNFVGTIEKCTIFLIKTPIF